MKKHAFLLAFFSILALTSCSLLPNMTPSRRNKSSSIDNGIVESSTKSSSKHTHYYSEWMVTVAPTCTQQGMEERYCLECGQTQTRNIYQLGHDFQQQEIIQQPTCTEPGYIQYRCSRCGYTELEEIKGGHDWSEPVNYQTSDEGCVTYLVSNCYRCGSSKIDINALDCTFAPGSSIKSGTANGFFKLASTGNSASWRFNYIPSEGRSGAYGMAYTRGMLDYWSSNPDKPYGVYSTSANDARPEGNFDFSVNGNIVDKSAYMNITFAELFADGEDSSYIGSNYSNIALVPVGEVYLQRGINEIVYTRTGSYNLLISDIVFIVTEENHTHVISNEWQCDENDHWHICTAEGCPMTGVRFDAASHTWGDPYDEVASTCEAEGSYKIRCSVCNYVKTVSVPQTDHNWVIDETQEIVQPTKDSLGHQTMVCLDCGRTQVVETLYGQTIETALTVEEAIEIGMQLGVKNQTDASYYVKGVVGEILNNAHAEGTVTLYLASSSVIRGFEFYRVSVSEGVNTEDIAVGAEVLGYGHIFRYQENAIEFSGKTNFLERIINKSTNDSPDGSYSCIANLVNDATTFINVALGGNLAYVRIGSATIFNATYTYDSTLRKVIIYLDEAGYGTFKATYLNGTLMGGHFSGSYGTQLVNNSNLLFNSPKVLFDCGGTTEELQSIFKRRYRSSDMWVFDTNNADRITSNSDAIMGNCLRLRPYANGAVALNKAEDFETPLECSSIGFWVYNPSGNDITLRMWVYRGADHTNAMEIGNVTAIAGQWTYCYMGFSTLSTYNFQIADFTNSGVALLFKNISFF